MDYTSYKLIHLLAVTIYLGYIFAGLYWMYLANKTKDLRIINHTLQGIIKGDRYFTMPAITIITIFGLFAAMIGNIPIMKSGWIAWSITVFLVSALVFSFGVIPAQKKMKKLTLNDDTTKEFDWTAYNKMFARWNTLSLIAFISSLSAFVMMILKIPK